MTPVSVLNLRKSYGGKPAVSDLSFTVEPGGILGLLGPNGAGMSLSIKVFRLYMLMSGKRPRVRQILRGLKDT